MEKKKKVLTRSELYEKIGTVTKSSGARMRENKPDPNSKYENGYFPVDKSVKYLGKLVPIYRSSLERRFMVFCETSPMIVEWDSEPFAIGYMKTDGTLGNYYVDFVATTIKGEKLFIEVKPYAQTKKGSLDWDTNKMKWNAAIKFCTNNQMKFMIVTERFKPLKNIK